jgi:hypothetical protein
MDMLYGREQPLPGFIRGQASNLLDVHAVQVLTKMTEMFPGAASADAGSMLGVQPAPPPQ